MSRALLVLDLTRDVASREGRFGGPHGTAEHSHSRDVPAKISSAIEIAREVGDLVVWIFPSDELFLANGMPASDEWGGEVDEDYGTPLDGEIVIRKTAIDPFVKSDLEADLRTSGVDEVVLVGISTTHVVSATARGAVERGFTTIVAADGCADHSEEAHRDALAALPAEVLITDLAQIW